MTPLESMDFDEEPAQPESFETAKPVPVRREPVPPSPRDVQTHEQYLLGCFLIDEGQTLDKAIAAGLASTDFTTPQAAATYAALRAMRAGNTPIALDTLVEFLGSRLSDAGGIQTLMALDQSATTARADFALREVMDASERRRLERLGLQIQEAAKKREPVADIMALMQGARLRQSGPALSSRRVHAAKPPPEPVTRLFLAGKPICTPGNITTLISRAKTGKTATLGAATAAIITAASGAVALKPDNLGFTAANPKGHAVIVIDTEQSPFDAYTCYKRSLDRAGQSADPKWLYHYCLVGIGPDGLKLSLDQAIALAEQECGKIFTLILDGCADFVNSVNDEAECNGFVNWLRERTVTHDCPAICVIHSNEGVKTGDDGRGHLGKQLTRKAESNLLLKKDGEITTITSEKQRKAPITEKDGIAFRWSDELQRHVSCESESKSEGKMGGRPAKYSFTQFTGIFPRGKAKAMTKQALLRFAHDIAPIKETAFRDILNEAVQSGDLDRVQMAHGYGYYLPLPEDRA